MCEGRTPPEVRRRAAEGQLPLPLSERIEALVWLATQGEAEIRARALSTLKNWKVGEMEQVLSDPATPAEVLNLFLESPELAREEFFEAVIRSFIITAEASADPSSLTEAVQATALAERSQAGSAPPDNETLLQRIGRMSASQKIRTALVGSTSERLILIRDANKAVARAVLMSPKVNPRDLEIYASMKNVAEEVLRALGTKRAFLRHYPVLRALANNPRTPVDVVLPLVARLFEHDLKALAVNRNVADTVRLAAAHLYGVRRGS